MYVVKMFQWDRDTIPIFKEKSLEGLITENFQPKVNRLRK
jgi:hypothetical protein